MSNLLHLIVHEQSVRWRDLLERSVSPDYRVRIYTDPEKRAKHIKKFYYTVLNMYPYLDRDCVDSAFEAYLLGWIEPYMVIQVAKQFTDAKSKLF